MSAAGRPLGALAGIAAHGPAILTFGPCAGSTRISTLRTISSAPPAPRRPAHPEARQGLLRRPTPRWPSTRACTASPRSQARARWGANRRWRRKTQQGLLVSPPSMVGCSFVPQRHLQRRGAQCHGIAQGPRSPAAATGDRNGPLPHHPARAQPQHPRAQVAHPSPAGSQTGVVRHQVQPPVLPAKVPPNPLIARSAFHQGQPLTRRWATPNTLSDLRRRAQVVMRLHQRPETRLLVHRDSTSHSSTGNARGGANSLTGGAGCHG